MNKYNNLKFLKRTKARVSHKRDKCEKIINPGDFYYAETLKDKFLHTLYNKKFCESCYKKYKNNLLDY